MIDLVQHGFFRGTVVAAVLIFLCTLVHYYAFVLLHKGLKCIHKKAHLKQIVLILFALFFAHTIHVWLFAAGYLFLIDVFQAGYFITAMGQPFDASFVDALYYSIVTYTSLGFGDIVPEDAIRLLTGVETLLGLLMIAWSASFTYLIMEKRWRL